MPLDCAASCLTVDVPVGARVIVASDLFLAPVPTPASTAATRELAQALATVVGPGALVVAGNLFELDEASAVGPCEALEAHGELAATLAQFKEAPDRRLIILPGSRDRAICYDPQAAADVRAHGFEIALSAQLAVRTGGGVRLVHVEPGWRYDPRNRFADPTDPHDTPLGHHAAVELFPALAASRSGWLEGIDRLQDPAGLPRFVASRLAYRRLGRYAWWLLIPFAGVVLARLPELWLFGVPSHLHGLFRPMLEIGFTLLAELLIVAVLLAVVNHRVWTGPASAFLGPPGDRANDAARDAARELVAGGCAGLVTGHTLRAELGSVGRGFFANTGACADVVEERRAVLGLPPVFVSARQVSFVEIEGGADVHARLLVARQQLPAGTLLERLAGGPRRSSTELSVVASFPGGDSWPAIEDRTRRRKTIRRVAGGVVGLIGLVDVISALIPVQVRGRLHPYLGYVPLGASEAAGALVALAGLALLLLARGLRRGHRIAWYVSVGTLAGTSILHLVRGGQFLQTAAALVTLAGLMWARDSFRARYDPPSLRTGVLTLVGGAVGVTLFVAAALELGVSIDKDGRSLPLTSALLAAAERLIGIDTVSLPHAVAVFLDPALLAVGLGLVAIALLIVLRPVVDRRLHVGAAGGRSEPVLGPEGSAAGDAEFRKARDVVQRRGSGTLDYFALRGDKQHFFTRDGVVAYAIHNGVCLVSPDPIGPAEERAGLWAAFRAFADEHGWPVAVLGAGEAWLPTYHRSGMRDLYIGDEAVVDVRTMSLQGGTKKGLRQAVNRIAKYGYTLSFHDPATVSSELAESLKAVMVQSRRGGMERGFSMTLGRIFDPADQGLLLAVARDPDMKPVAFCQFVPAPGIEGYSLDLMRRDNGEHPNGLFDFILVRTMERLREQGFARLGLNFAMMRAVLAGEAGDGISTRVERWILKRMSDSMQIESLWRFNAKFDPEWLPRYVVWDSAEQSLAAALAIARAESFWELPIIGRFLVPSADSAGSEAGGDAGAAAAAAGAAAAGAAAAGAAAAGAASAAGAAAAAAAAAGAGAAAAAAQPEAEVDSEPERQAAL